MHWGIDGILRLLAGIALAAAASAVTFRLWHRFASRARGRPGYALPRAGPPTPLDHIHVQGFDPMFLALNAHRNIEVRLFNPIRNRGHVLRRALEAALGMTRYNRRLHSKAWIADGRTAIIGSRNIGDTYFGRAGGRPSDAAPRTTRALSLRRPLASGT